MADVDAIPDTLTLPLRKPLTGAGIPTPVEQLQLREPTAGELTDVGAKSEDEAGIWMVATVSGLPETTIGRLGARDFGAASAYLLSFTADDDEVVSAADDIPDELTVQLRTPIEVPGRDEPLAALELREPTADELRASSRKKAHEQAVFLVSKVSGIPATAIRKIGARDFKRAAGYLTSFTTGGQTTGKPA